MTLPLTLPPVAAYRGDTTEIAESLSVGFSDDEGAADSTALVHVRDKERGTLFVVIEPDILSSTLGALLIAPVTMLPEHWATIPRKNKALAFDMEVTHPVLGTKTLVVGSVTVTNDVTYTADP